MLTTQLLLANLQGLGARQVGYTINLYTVNIASLFFFLYTVNIASLFFFSLLYEAIQDESAELCFIFRSARSVLYFPLENIVPEILLRIRCNKPVKVPLTLVHYGKYCTQAWSRGKYSTRLRLALY